jgi:hypothetical protein
MDRRALFQLALPLLVASGTAIADWDKAFTTPTADHYLDPASVERLGSTRRIWTLQDLKSLGKRGERSMKAQMEYDCDKRRVRAIQATAHTGQMATGEIVESFTRPAQWNEILPNSAFSTTLVFVCRR